MDLTPSSTTGIVYSDKSNMIQEMKMHVNVDFDIADCALQWLSYIELFTFDTILLISLQKFVSLQ